MTSKDNPIASALAIIGILFMVGGLIVGTNYGTSYEYAAVGSMQSAIGLSFFFSGLISGMIFLGFSEIIKLLQGIYNQRENELDRQNKDVVTLEEMSAETKAGVRYVVTEQAKQTTHEFYKGKTVTDIQATSEEDVYEVLVDGVTYERIDLGGFKPKVIRSRSIKEE